MTYRTRQFMFYGAVLLFLVSSYVAFLYAQGYKYSFEENEFVRTGAIYLNANESAKVFVEDELIDSTSFLLNTVGIDRLLPGQYTVRLQKDGFSSWQKRVTVQEGMVTDFTKIILLPQSDEKVLELTTEIEEILSSASGDIVFAPSPTPKPRKTSAPRPTPADSAPSSPSPSIDGPEFYIEGKDLFQRAPDGQPKLIGANALGFSISKDNDRILWWTANELWVLWLKDSDFQPYKNKGEKELITRFSAPIQKAGWFRDNNHAVVDSSGYRVVEIDTRGGINIIKI